MTPEERAMAALDHTHRPAEEPNGAWICRICKESLAQAIREAVEDEREACARVADEYTCKHHREDYCYCENGTRDLAYNIRFRKD